MLCRSDNSFLIRRRDSSYKEGGLKLLKGFFWPSSISINLDMKPANRYFRIAKPYISVPRSLHLDVFSFVLLLEMKLSLPISYINEKIHIIKSIITSSKPLLNVEISILFYSSFKTTYLLVDK